TTGAHDSGSCAGAFNFGELARDGVVRSVLIIVVGFCLAAANAAERTILLMDDTDILYRSGTKRVLCPLTRSPANPMIKGGVYPGETAIAWMSIYRDPGTGNYHL